MKIEILTTTKIRKIKGVTGKYPNLDIKSINGKPYKAEYQYLENGECKAILEFEQ